MLNSISKNVLLLILLTVALGTTSASAQITHTVNLDGTVFDPADITIKIGDTVHWVWVSGSHNVESGVIDGGAGVPDSNFRSGDPTGDDTTIFDLTFDQAFLDAKSMTDNVYPYYCVVHAGVDMSGKIKVLLDGECITNDHCDDGIYCNGEETCVEGACQDGTAIDCDDSIECTIDSCNEGTDTCDHAADDTVCEDDLYCNGADTCSTSTGCVHAGSPCVAGKVCDEDTDLCVNCLVDEDCNDGIDCTIDSCNENVCSHQAFHSICEDNVYCNGIEICKLTEGCKSLGNPCATSFCDEDSDSCASCQKDSDCDDEDDCTDDACISGECEFESIEGCGDVIDDSSDDTTDTSGGTDTADDSDPNVGQVTPPLCGAFGMIPMLLMFFGLVGAKTQRRRKHTL